MQLQPQKKPRRIVPELVSPTTAAPLQPHFPQSTPQQAQQQDAGPSELVLDLKEQADYSLKTLGPGRRIWFDLTKGWDLNWKKVCQTLSCCCKRCRNTRSLIVDFLISI
jgi:hypothetical protein